MLTAQQYALLHDLFQEKKSEAVNQASFTIDFILSSDRKTTMLGWLAEKKTLLEDRIADLEAQKTSTATRLNTAVQEVDDTVTQLNAV